MVYITGDLHGHWEELASVSPLLHAGDKIILAGDCGYGMVPEQEEILDRMEQEMPFEILLLDGNHENFDALYALPVEEWNGGRVHRIRKNIVHLMRGEIFRLEGHTVFALGGGYSLDKARQQAMGQWWPQELPSEEEYRNAEANLDRVHDQVDFLVTHTAPYQTVTEYLRRVYRMQPLREDEELTRRLETIRGRTADAYKHWYFGHYHIDAMVWRRQTAILHAVRELESGEIVGRKANMWKREEETL